MPRLTYPTPPTAAQVDDYHGTPIADPYRTLEDGDAPASREWIAAQNELTARALQDHDVLWTANGPEAEGAVLLDPNRLGEQGTTALSAVAVSESGELVACATGRRVEKPRRPIRRNP